VATWDVAFLPSHIGDVSGRTCIVVDVLRASTTIAAMFGRRVERVAVAQDATMARQWKAISPKWKLAGEEKSLKPAGFDFGNSPIELGSANLAGLSVILSTSNGTRALRSCRQAEAVYSGALVNGPAVVKQAIADERDVTIVCAGTGLGTQVAMEDVYAAGKLISFAVERGQLDITDGARIALAVVARFGSPFSAFAASSHGKRLISLGMSSDLEACSEIGTSESIPAMEAGRRWPILRELSRMTFDRNQAG
jgi:2-phosphosulfolactate phosphatase